MADSDSGSTMDERAITRAGNPGNPHGLFGEQMLERMNQSHADVTNWALDQLEFKAGDRALDIGCGGGATMGRIAGRIQAAGGMGHVSGVDISEVSCEASRIVRPGGGRFLLVADVYHRPGLAPDVLQNIERYDLTVLAPSEYERLLVEASFSRAKVHLKDGTTWIAVEAER